VQNLPAESIWHDREIHTSMKAIQIKQPGGPEAMELVELDRKSVV
jgi:hypothetical protein